MDDPRCVWGEQAGGVWYFFPSVLRHCCFGNRKGIQPVKRWMLRFVGGDDLTWALWLQLSASPDHPLLGWNPDSGTDLPGISWKMAINRVSSSVQILAQVPGRSANSSDVNPCPCKSSPCPCPGPCRRGPCPCPCRSSTWQVLFLNLACNTHSIVLIVILI